ncbi:hypothetical protein D3C73_1465800 [compost metagenome]
MPSIRFGLYNCNAEKGAVSVLSGRLSDSRPQVLLIGGKCPTALWRRCVTLVGAVAVASAGSQWPCLPRR